MKKYVNNKLGTFYILISNDKNFCLQNCTWLVSQGYKCYKKYSCMLFKSNLMMLNGTPARCHECKESENINE